MIDKIQALRGMNDILPHQTALWRCLENILESCLLQYGYQEIRFPLVESTQLFKRTIGSMTDIVEKEMYTFTDLNGESLTLRPEGTASCVRACLEHALLHKQPQKLWYSGPMFRHERPQKGRYRQFHHFGVEALGFTGTAIELELIAIGQRLWASLGLEKIIHLEINTLGLFEERQLFKEKLIEFLRQNFNKLDEDSQRRLERNPLRILDSKNTETQALLVDSPRLMDYLGEDSKQAFKSLCDGLENMNIPYTINPFLVRGLDYYGQVVFEWVTQKLGSQATVCAGGRYDCLVEQLGGKPTPAIGFAMGMERLILLLEAFSSLTLAPKSVPTFFFIGLGLEAEQLALKLAEELRDKEQTWQVITNTAGGSVKSQFKKADKSRADYALILGEDEIIQKSITVKNLRKSDAQVTVAITKLHEYLTCLLGGADVNISN